MADFPDFCYQEQGYSFEFSPNVVRTEFASSNTRQRLLFGGSDDKFSVKHRLTSDELATFESFVLDTLNNGADTYTGPYYVSDSKKTGTLEILNGKYNVRYNAERWDVSYTFSLKDRDLTDEQAIYELVTGLTSFELLYDLIQATENTINYNNL